MTKRSVLLMALLVLLTASLACSKAGKILTPAEATASAMPTAVPTVETMAGEHGLAPGDTAYLVNRSYLVNFYDAPGSKKIVTAQQRGVEVKILNIGQAPDGTIWYQVEAPAGTGWVPESNISTEAP
jgi:hypothetical protein